MELNGRKTVVVVRRVGVFAAMLASVVLGASAARAVDLDGDNKDEFTVYRPTDPNGGVGLWYTAPTAQNVTLTYQWGLPGDYPVAGNYFQATRSDIAVWRPSDGVWYFRKFDSGLNFTTTAAYQWGLSGDNPQPCDFNGDGLNDLAVFRNSDGTWYLRNSNAATPASTYSTATVQQWGLPGDTPIPADYDIDGKCDFSVFRQGNWYVILSSTNGQRSATIPWGAAGDIPVPGQYDGDNILDFAVYRASASAGPSWIIRHSTLAGLTYSIYQWGSSLDLPVPGDYDGDGKTDLAVWRQSTGVWYIRTSSSGYASAVATQFGLTNDIPVGERRGANPS